MSQRFNPRRFLGALGAVLACSMAMATVTASTASAATPATAGTSVASGSSKVVPTPSGPGAVTVGSGTESATIYRDTQGVPHVYSTTTSGMFFGDGWAQAQDRSFQLELTRAAVLGNLSKLFGTGELSTDEAQRLLYYTTAQYQTQFNHLTASDQAALVAYTNGINAYEAQAYSTLGSELAMVPIQFWALGKQMGLKTAPYRPSPWTPIDTMAVAADLVKAFGAGGGLELRNLSYLQYLTAYFTKKGVAQPGATAMAVFNDARWITDPSAPTTVPATCPDGPLLSNPLQSKPNQCVAAPSGSPYGAVANASKSTGSSASISKEQAAVADVKTLTPTSVLQATKTLQTDKTLLLKRGVKFDVVAHGGSNAIAVAPWRSADHHALLWGAPQEGLGTPSVDYEVYLHGPSYDASGMAIAGEPFILIGHNGNISWTTTSEGLTTEGVFVEQVKFTHTVPSTYLFDGKYIPVTKVTESIPVAGQSPRTYTFYRTKDGPIFSSHVTTATNDTGIAYSMDYTFYMKEYKTFEGFSQLGGDTNLKQFTHSMSLIVSAHNFLYADRQGNIAYFADGLVPSTPSPFSASANPSLPHLGTGSQQWDTFIPFTKMPHSINPGQGYLDNWNTKPAPGMYEQTTGPGTWGTIYRSQPISQMLSASTHITIGYLSTIQHSVGAIDGSTTRVAAPYFIPYLESAYQTLVSQGSTLVTASKHPELNKAMLTLETWDTTMPSGNPPTIGSPAMSIFVNFLHALESNVSGGGLNPGEQYVGTVNLNEATLGKGTYAGLTNMTSYNMILHALEHLNKASTRLGIVPCTSICYTGTYFGGNPNQILVESLNNAITILSSSTSHQLGHSTAPGFGTPTITKWGWVPTQNETWSGSLTPVAQAATVTVKSVCGTSASQNRSTYYLDMDMAPVPFGEQLMPPGESGFIGLHLTSNGTVSAVPSPYLCDQVAQFNAFTYAPISSSVSQVQPSSGPAGGGQSVTITGYHLTGATEVYFGTVPATSFSVDSSTTITAVTPPGSGTVDVRVMTPADPAGTTANPYDRYGFQGALTSTLNAPVVGIATTPTGGGYWEVASDGGIFAFGNAQFYGSMGGQHLNAPVVGIATTPTGGGYWEVASDGGIFAFGNATFDGSMGGKALNAPVVGIATTPTGGGYWEVASDGGIFAFGNAG
ncbi:MAG: penicillin acylase family protein, partial [Acidimicrobiales bacterium]